MEATLKLHLLDRTSPLSQNAIFAPHWSPNGHQILHILRGTANLEIAGPGGIKLLNQKVKEGDVIVIPRFHAAGVRAEDEFEWVTFYSTDMYAVKYFLHALVCLEP